MTMTDPYRSYYEDEDLEELDPAVAEAIALDKAIQNSLEVSSLPQRIGR